MNGVAPEERFKLGPEELMRIQDGIRRVRYNARAVEDMMPRVYQERFFVTVRRAIYSNFLSSVYAQQDITAAISKRHKKEFPALLSSFVRSDPSLAYVRAARIAEDHTANPAITSPYLRETGKKIGMHGNQETTFTREMFDLDPIPKSREYPDGVPIPDHHLGVRYNFLTPRILAMTVAGWWLTLTENILDRGQFTLPTAPTPMWSLRGIERYAVAASSEIAHQNALGWGRRW